MAKDPRVTYLVREHYCYTDSEATNLLEALRISKPIKRGLPGPEVRQEHGFPGYSNTPRHTIRDIQVWRDSAIAVRRIVFVVDTKYEDGLQDETLRFQVSFSDQLLANLKYPQERVLFDVRKQIEDAIYRGELADGSFENLVEANETILKLMNRVK